MQRLLFGLFVISGAMLFLLNNELLDVLGWSFSSESGPFLTKIHPATYLLIPTALLALLTKPYVVLRAMSDRIFLFYVIATMILFVRSVIMVVQGFSGGEVGTVITNFFTPILILLVAACIRPDSLAGLTNPLRIFFVINSLMALAERIIGHRIIPNIMDQYSDPRSTALVHHPLNGSLLTGLVIVYLVSARRKTESAAIRIGELALHGVAMFAFGGRSALVFTATTLLLSSVTASNRTGEARISGLQRALPILIIALGLCLVLLPIDFIDATLDRFTNDKNSAQQRNAAFDIIGAMTQNEFLWGMNVFDRMRLMDFFGSFAIEISWLALIMSFGLIATLPMIVAFPMQIYATARPLDRSAMFMGFLFFIVTIGSLAIGVKTPLVCEFFLMLLVLCQRQQLLVTTLLRQGDASAETGVTRQRPSEDSARRRPTR